MKRFRLYRLGVRYPVTVLCVSLLLTLVSFFYIAKLKLITDFATLLPQHSESVQNFNLLQKHFGNQSNLVIAVESNDPQKTKQFAEAFAHAIEKNSSVQYVDYEKPVEFFKQRQWLFLDLQDLKMMEERLNRSLKLQKEGVSPVFNKISEFADEEDRPDITFADLRQKYDKKMMEEAKRLDPDQEGKMKILWVKPTQGVGNIEWNRQWVAQIRQIEKEIRRQGDYASVDVGYTGEYPSSVEEFDLTQREVAQVSTIVTILLFLILILYYRRFSSAFLIGFPLFISVAWTGGILYFALKHLNLITAFGAAILAGLGSDYGIFLLTRFYHEQKMGKSFEECCELSFSNTGRATFGSMVTTVGSFLALLFSGFGVFVEFGVLGATGLVMNYVGMMLLMPALLTLGHRFSQYGWYQRLHQWNILKLGNFSKAATWLEHLFLPRKPRLGILITVALLGVCAVTLAHESKIYFEDGQMDTKNLPGNKVYEKVSTKLHATLRPTLLLSQGLEETRRTVEAIDKKIDASKPGTLVYNRILGLTTFLPEHTDEKRKIIARLVKQYEQAKLINAQEREKVIESLKETLASSDVTLENLPQAVKRVFTPIDSSGYYASYLYPSIGRGSSENADKYYAGVEELKKEENLNFRPVDSAFIQRDVTHLIQQEAPRGMALILVFFAVFLFLTVRPISRSFLIYLHLLGSLVLLSGTLWLLDVRLNVMNIAMLPIVLGTGIDCFIHLSHRYDEDGHLDHVIQMDIPAIFISSLTSIVGFGGFLFTSSMGLRSIGWVAVLGLSWVTLTCVLVFPRFLAFRGVRRLSLQKLESQASEMG
ncbi:MAG: MMPL family transporter [bacterium]